MSRAHLYRAVVDAQGNLLTDVSVRVLDPGTTTSISDPIYMADDGTTVLANPVVCPGGVLNFYLAAPKRVRLGVTAGSAAEVFYEDVDVLVPGGGAAFRPGAGVRSVIGGDLNTPATADTTDSIALGDGATATGNPDAPDYDSDALAFGNASSATGHTAHAIGFQASANNHGANAYGPYAYADGYNASAGGINASAEGRDTSAYGTNADASGDAASAYGARSNAQGVRASALGSYSYASADGALAVGPNTMAQHVNAWALGNLAETTKPNQGMVRADEVHIMPASALPHGSTTVLYANDGTPHVIGVAPNGITFDGVVYTAGFSLQTIVSGNLVVANHIVKPGLRVHEAGTAVAFVVRADTPPAGADVHITATRWNNGVYAEDIGTVVLPVGESVASVVVSVDCAKGDIIKFNTTQIGSTTSGADVNLSVDFL